MKKSDPSFWQVLDRILEEVLEIPSDQRERYLERHCKDSPEMFEEIKRLLKHHDTNPTFLETPLHEFVGPILEDDAIEDANWQPEKQLGPYTLIRELGRGGMARVYLAEHRGRIKTREVAIKFVRFSGASEQLLTRFQHERRILASLNHPHIAKLYDEGVASDGSPYLVMEYVEGEPIHKFCDSNQLDIPSRLRLFTQITDAVHHAHLHRIIHRDIKPNNILVSKEGLAKLLDFGIAKMLDSTTRLTRTGMRIMTPEYACPEQIQGQRITPASDVYQLGVLLYELLTGHRPYPTRGASTREIERMIMEDHPPLPSEAVRLPDHLEGSTSHITRLRNDNPESLSQQLAGALDNILTKTLRKEPERRYATAEALNRDLKRYLEGSPVLAKPEGGRLRPSKWIQRWKRK